jgi:hypothetical protein
MGSWGFLGFCSDHPIAGIQQGGTIDADSKGKKFAAEPINSFRGTKQFPIRDLKR